jgi:hypothetical protein
MGGRRVPEQRLAIPLERFHPLAILSRPLMDGPPALDPVHHLQFTNVLAMALWLLSSLTNRSVY